MRWINEEKNDIYNIKKKVENIVRNQKKNGKMISKTRKENQST